MKTIHEDEGYETAGNNGQNKLRTALNGPIVDINTSVVNSLEKSLENSANPVSGVALATPTVNAIAADCTAEATPSTSAEGKKPRSVKCVSESDVRKILPGQPTSKKVLSKKKTTVTVKLAEARSVLCSYTRGVNGGWAGVPGFGRIDGAALLLVHSDKFYLSDSLDLESCD